MKTSEAIETGKILANSPSLSDYHGQVLLHLISLAERATDEERILAVAKTCKTSLSGLRTLEDIATTIVKFIEEGK
jgi:hypothetical protein